MWLCTSKKLLAVLAGVAFIASCKKDVSEKNPTPPATEPSVETKLKDSTLLYSRDIYLWYNQIPTDFNPQTYADPDKLMQALRKYSIEPGFTGPVDRWSFAYKQQDWNNVSSGVSQGFGMNVFFLTEGDLRVRQVEPQSAAGLAGIRRGWRITRINGNTNITTSNASFISTNVYQSGNANFTFQKPDGTSVDILLQARAFQEQPVVLDTVYQAGSKKVAYMVFNSFLGDTTQIYNDFNRAFNKFSSQQATDLIIDLRYNGGGYVSVQETLANFVVPAANNGQVMMTQQFNDKYSRFNSTTRFNKRGNLNVSRVFFIVSASTASASELLINNLKPYMDVKLVGPSKTYGKPMGFFPIPIYDWYIFPVSFKTVNKNGEGSYYNGLPLDVQVADGLNKDWGDVNESALASILQGFNSGTYRAAGASDVKIDARMQPVNALLEPNSFKGTIGRSR